MGERLVITGIEPVQARTQLSEARGVIPPIPPTNVGSGEASPEPQPEATDAELFWIMHDRSAEDFPGLQEIVDRYDLTSGEGLPPVSEERVKRVMKKAEQERLVEPHKLSILQYIGALLPRRR